MKPDIFIAVALLAFAIYSCTGNPAKSNSSSEAILADTSEPLPPVENRNPVTNYIPAFKDQTRVHGIKTTAEFEVKIITSALRQPWGIANLPDGRVLISQKQGSFVIVSKDGVVSDSIGGVPRVNSEGQGGLLGIAIDPDFEENRMVYWCFSEKTSKGNETAVAKGRLSNQEDKIEGAKVIYRVKPAFNSVWHYGGRLLFDKSGNLFVSTGEHGEDETRIQAQKLNSAIGKILRIDVDGNPAKGNPFEKVLGARAEIWSYGHRNIQGLAFNPETGDLWESEFGPLGGDELNLIKPGRNYGWPVITYGCEYSGDKIGDGITQKEGLEQPVYYWDPVISPSGIVFYNSEIIPEWKNNLFICGLSGNCITRLRIEENRVVGEERLLADEKQRFRDITMGRDGNLYIITDEGRLYELGVKG